MKKNLFVLALVISSFVSYSQNNILIFGGPQLTSAFYSVGGKAQEVSTRPAFHLGSTFKVPFEGHLFFSPTLFYSLKGYKVTLTQPSIPPDSFAIGNKTRIHTLEIAALLQYDFSLKPGHFYFKAGPTIDMQLSGKEKFTRQDGSVVSRKMKYSWNDYGYVGANIFGQLGFETRSGLLFGISYSHGLGSISNVDYGARILHQVTALSIGKYLMR